MWSSLASERGRHTLVKGAAVGEEVWSAPQRAETTADFPQKKKKSIDKRRQRSSRVPGGKTPSTVEEVDDYDDAEEDELDSTSSQAAAAAAAAAAAGFQEEVSEQIRLTTAMETALCRRGRRRFHEIQASVPDARVRFDRRKRMVKVAGPKEAVDFARRQVEALGGTHKPLPDAVWHELLRTRNEDASKSLLLQVQQQTGCRIHIERGLHEVRLFGPDNESEAASILLDRLSDMCVEQHIRIKEGLSVSPSALHCIAETCEVTFAPRKGSITVYGLRQNVYNAAQEVEAELVKTDTAVETDDELSWPTESSRRQLSQCSATCDLPCSWDFARQTSRASSCSTSCGCLDSSLPPFSRLTSTASSSTAGGLDPLTPFSRLTSTASSCAGCPDAPPLACCRLAGSTASSSHSEHAAVATSPAASNTPHCHSVCSTQTLPPPQQEQQQVTWVTSTATTAASIPAASVQRCQVVAAPSMMPQVPAFLPSATPIAAAGAGALVPLVIPAVMHASPPLAPGAVVAQPMCTQAFLVSTMTASQFPAAASPPPPRL